MPLDTRIPLGVQPIQLDSPDKVAAERLTLANLTQQQQAGAMQLEGARKAQADAQALADVYRQSVGADGKLDRTAFAQNAASRGLGAQLPGIQEGWAKGDKAQGEADAARFKLASDRLEMSGKALGSLAALPASQLTHDAIFGTIAGLVEQGVMDPQQGAMLARRVPPRPEALRDYVRQAALMVATAQDRLKAITPQYRAVNAGKQTVFVDENTFTNPDGPGAVTMTTTPGEDLQASTSRRNADVQAATAAADRRSREGIANADRSSREAGGAIEVVKGENGAMALVNKRTGQSRPVVDAAGKPVQFNNGQLDAKQALDLVNQAEPLLRTATGSWVGRGMDMLAAAFGASTEGAISGAKLKALEGMLISKMPKMSGPQSDKDVETYRQMAGKIGDATTPREERLAALDTVREIQERYAGMAPNSSRPKPSGLPSKPRPAGAPAAPAAGGGQVLDWNALP
jgi:hypothetical protein